MYDPRSQRLKQLSKSSSTNKPSASLGYLGDHEWFEDILPDFVSGRVHTNGKVRPSDIGNKVIDKERLKRAWKTNEVDESSFLYIDREFFRGDKP